MFVPGYFLSESIAIAQCRVAVREVLFIDVGNEVGLELGVRQNGPVFQISTGPQLVVHSCSSG